ncbi:MAG: hypothetical protein Q8M94_01505, partial [Ignavibacteria bacterium]|nr:hypothetical protein [Ignavibacteria bacterium]
EKASLTNLEKRFAISPDYASGLYALIDALNVRTNLFGYTNKLIRLHINEIGYKIFDLIVGRKTPTRFMPLFF